MAEIRGGFDTAFIEKITENFLDSFSSEIHPKDALREKIRVVRARNHDPLFMEMLLAMWESRIDVLKEVIRRYSVAAELDAAHNECLLAETVLSDKIIAYLDGRPKEIAKKGADALHSKPGGSREKAAKMREAWATGKYSSRDVCAEQECAALGMSFSSARKALRNTPDPA